MLRQYSDRCANRPSHVTPKSKRRRFISGDVDDARASAPNGLTVSLVEWPDAGGPITAPGTHREPAQPSRRRRPPAAGV